MEPSEMSSLSCQHRLPAQLFAVARHAERADDVGAAVEGMPWCLSQDSHCWPQDPPLSDSGQKVAKEFGEKLRVTAQDLGTEVHVVVSSPYFRCVQTAAQVCQSLGPDTKLLIDNSLGEIFGPCVMGEVEPVSVVRPLQQSIDFCSSIGISCLEARRLLGSWPQWPETLRSARQRMARRFEEYLRRGHQVRRNFVLVSHADCVGAALSLIPAESGCRHVEKVNFCGYFLAMRRLGLLQPPPSQEQNRGSRPAYEDVDSPTQKPPGTNPKQNSFARRRAAALRRQEAMQAIRSRSEWTGHEGLVPVEDQSPDVSSLGGSTGRSDLESISFDHWQLGENWQLELSGVRCRRHTFGGAAARDAKVVRHSALPVQGTADHGHGYRLQMLEALPEAPLGISSSRRPSCSSIASTELFGGLSLLGSRVSSRRASAVSAVSSSSNQEPMSPRVSDEREEPQHSELPVGFGIAADSLCSDGRELPKTPASPRTPASPNKGFSRWSPTKPKPRADLDAGFMSSTAADVAAATAREADVVGVHAEPGNSLEPREPPVLLGRELRKPLLPKLEISTRSKAPLSPVVSPTKSGSPLSDPDTSPLYQRRLKKLSAMQFRTC
eukprot:TRINITY_DN10035_c0_g1_i1.p1 TRINITY_DN10035_c0_g1~~TRINITY_DN10035_c0_g1_i1.p1  ORF type:complete len:630 (+),score=112.31 TRINITY_DN10035_c0_g1_i1:68-1891(+)